MNASPELLGFLENLCGDERNTVYVIGGKPKAIMDSLFGAVPKLGLGAEYGYHYKPYTKNTWKTTKISIDKSWMEKARLIMKQYVDHTNGSYIEEKDCSMVWMYKEADYELGEWQAVDLIENLQHKMQGNFLMVVDGKGFVEVKPRVLQKGYFATKVINEVIKRKKHVDFILCLGDDIGDEHTFKKVNKYKATSFSETSCFFRCKMFTVTVGRKPSHADYFVGDYTDALRLIKDISSLGSKVTISSNNF